MDIFAEHRDMIDEQYLAVIDTETNMFDEVISVAVVVAHKETYGVQHMIRRLTKSEWYFEKHNAAYDAEDELMIMQLIGYPADWYPSL